MQIQISPSFPILNGLLSYLRLSSNLICLQILFVVKSCLSSNLVCRQILFVVKSYLSSISEMAEKRSDIEGIILITFYGNKVAPIETTVKLQSNMFIPFLHKIT